MHCRIRPAVGASVSLSKEQPLLFAQLARMEVGGEAPHGTQTLPGRAREAEGGGSVSWSVGDRTGKPVCAADTCAGSWLDCVVSAFPPMLRSREEDSHFGHPTAGQTLTSLPANARFLQPLHLCPAMGLHSPGTQGAAGPCAQGPVGLITHLPIFKPLLYWQYYWFFFSYCYIMNPVISSPSVSSLYIF